MIYRAALSIQRQGIWRFQRQKINCDQEYNGARENSARVRRRRRVLHESHDLYWLEPSRGPFSIIQTLVALPSRVFHRTAWLIFS